MEFELLKENGELIKKEVTNDKGIISFKDLYQGKYVLRETKANENYVIDNMEFNIDVKYNETSNIDITNEHKKGNLKINKLDKENTKIALGNVEFDLYSYELDKVIGTYYTDANGEIYIENLRTGEYKLIEKVTNRWYDLAGDTQINIEWNKTTENTVYNELKKGQIKIIKVDSDNKEIHLKGVNFEIRNSKGELIETLVTDDNGQAISKRIPINDEYIVKEISTLDNYILNNETISLNLNSNEIKELVIENRKIKGYIEILKVSSDDNKITGDKKGNGLENVEFEIYDSDDKLVENLKTDERGIAKTSLLEKGRYKIKEIKTKDGYIINNDINIIDILEDGKVYNLLIKNEPVKANIDIEKTGQSEASPGEEIKYKINIKNKSNVSVNNFNWRDKILTDYIKLIKFETGTYNKKLNYNIYYKTNLSNDQYVLLLEDINTLENYEIDFSKELPENEYVTELYIEFGIVCSGFTSNKSPIIYTKVKDNLKSETSFVNEAIISAEYNGYMLEDISKWKTIVYKILPVTGL